MPLETGSPDGLKMTCSRNYMEVTIYVGRRDRKGYLIIDYFQFCLIFAP